MVSSALSSATLTPKMISNFVSRPESQQDLLQIAELSLASVSSNSTRRPEFPLKDTLDDLGEVLLSRKGHEAMFNFLVSEFSEENLVFWGLVENFREIVQIQLDNQTVVAASSRDGRCVSRSPHAGKDIVFREVSDDDHLTAHQVAFSFAKAIYDQFICPNSKTTINVSSEVRKNIEAFFQGYPAGGCNQELVALFDAAQKECMYLMQKDSFLRFKKSNFYFHLQRGAEKAAQQSHALNEMVSMGWIHGDWMLRFV